MLANKWEEIEGDPVRERTWFLMWLFRIQAVADLKCHDARFFYYFDAQPDPWVHWRPAGSLYILASYN